MLREDRFYESTAHPPRHTRGGGASGRFAAAHSRRILPNKQHDRLGYPCAGRGQLVDAKGDAGFSGYDILTLDEQGLILTILLFGNVEAQKLAWRRRDPVSLELTK
jgi:hypothetical protein